MIIHIHQLVWHNRNYGECVEYDYNFKNSLTIHKGNTKEMNV